MPDHPVDPSRLDSGALTTEQARVLATHFLDRVAAAVACGALSIGEATELHERLLAAAETTAPPQVRPTVTAERD